jgi:hypothetical protein
VAAEQKRQAMLEQQKQIEMQQAAIKQKEIEIARMQ